MKAKRFEQLLEQQTAVALKVFNAVSANEAWPSKRVYQELRDSGTPVRDMRMVEGCLASLVKSKLILEKPTGMFKQLVPSDAAPGKEEVPLEVKLPGKEKTRYKPDAAQIEAWSQAKDEPTETAVETPEAVTEPETPAEPVVVTEVPLVLPKLPPIPGQEKTDALAQVAVDVPEGHFSQYLLPKHDILVNYPNSGGTQNYTILMAAEPGDVVRFARPEGLSLSAWRGRIQATRWNYYNKHGILLEAHFFQAYVDLLVMRQDTVGPPVNTLTVSDREVSAEEERTFPSRSLGTTTTVTSMDGIPSAYSSAEEYHDHLKRVAEVEADMAQSSTVELVEDLPVPETEESVDVPFEMPFPLFVTTTICGPDPDDYMVHEAMGEFIDLVINTDPVVAVAPADPRTDSVVEREFWQKVFFAQFERLYDVDRAIGDADAALAAHRKHFMA